VRYNEAFSNFINSSTEQKSVYLRSPECCFELYLFIHNTCEAKRPTVAIFEAVALGAVLKTWTFDKCSKAMPS
jgi:hypothetical protein